MPDLFLVRLILALWWGVAPPPPLRILELGTVPDTVRTGDAFLLRVRVAAGRDMLSPGDLDFPERIPVQGGIESRGDGRWSESGGEGGETEWTVEYPLQALRPGPLQLPPLNVGVRAGDALDPDGGVRTRWVALPLGTMSVVSRLPSSGVAVDPADPLPPPRSPWDLPEKVLLLSLGCALTLGVGWLLAGRREESHQDTPAPRDGAGAFPRDRAEAASQLLALLAGLEARPHPAGEMQVAVDQVVTGIRRVLEGASGRGLGNHTTPELLGAARVVGGARGLSQLEEALREGDRLRFGAQEPDPRRLPFLLARVRVWLEASDG